jgi:phosphoribosylformylglycinamidine synthase subunit PurL
VNAFTLGILKTNKIFRGTASGVGNPVIYIGARTGRDGIHGATMASAEFDAESEKKRPTVQVGDPFMEKLLLEACLELFKTDCLVGIQDMGAAGLTSSSVEMASRAGSGLLLDVDAVPRRESGMTPYEVMLSESQERMLVLVKPSAEPAARRIIDAFDLHADRVGTILAEPRVRVRDRADIVVDLPLDALIDGVPARSLAGVAPYSVEAPTIRALDDPAAMLVDLLARPNLRSRRAIYRRYDHQVGNSTVIGPGFDAALLRIPGTTKGLALTTDGNSRFVALDPYAGTQLAVAEAARNIACTGARPLAVTNCLNFGNPERPSVAWQLAESVRGLGDACRTLGLPVVSGNVSLYNEWNGMSIPPTPVVGMVGILNDLERRCRAGFRSPGDLIFLLGETRDDLAGSEYAEAVGAPLAGPAPRADLRAEVRLLRALNQAIESGALASAHDVADGGLLVAIAECALFGGLGAQCPSLSGQVSPAGLYFGETPGRVVVTVSAKRAPELQQVMAAQAVPLQALGVVGGDELVVGNRVRVPLERLWRAWETPW